MEKTPTEVELYQSKGLTEAESSLVQKWVEKGRPGISNIKADHLLSIYLMGYTCYDINKEFPEYSLESILWAKAKFDWEQKKSDYQKSIAQSVVTQAATAKAESIRFISDILQATHIKWKKDIMRYLAAPDREKAPACLPNSMNEYGKLLNLLDSTIAAEKEKLPAEAVQTGNNGALVNVNISSGTDPKNVTITQGDVKNQLVLEMNQPDKKPK